MYLGKFLKKYIPHKGTLKIVSFKNSKKHYIIFMIWNNCWKQHKNMQSLTFSVNIKESTCLITALELEPSPCFWTKAFSVLARRDWKKTKLLI